MSDALTPYKGKNAVGSWFQEQWTRGQRNKVKHGKVELDALPEATQKKIQDIQATRLARQMEKITTLNDFSNFAMTHRDCWKVLAPAVVNGFMDKWFNLLARSKKVEFPQGEWPRELADRAANYGQYASEFLQQAATSDPEEMRDNLPDGWENLPDASRIAALVFEPGSDLRTHFKGELETGAFSEAVAKLRLKLTDGYPKLAKNGLEMKALAEIHPDLLPAALRGEVKDLSLAKFAELHGAKPADFPAVRDALMAKFEATVNTNQPDFQEYNPGYILLAQKLGILNKKGWEALNNRCCPRM